MQILGDVNEGSTAKVTATITDIDTGLPISPKSATWSLFDESGAIVNSREDVVISPLASTVNVVLSGLDLVVTNGSILTFVLDAIYDSALGSDLPVRSKAKIRVNDILE